MQIATRKILEKLYQLKNNKGITTIDSYSLERNLLPKGKGCLSVSRIVRRLRQAGFLRYDDPRSNNHKYIISFNEKMVKEYLKKKNKKTQNTKNKTN